MKKEIDFNFEYELWDDNDTLENKSVRFSQIYDEAKSIIENNNNSESWEGTSPSKYWTDKDSYGETDDEKREELTLLFNNFDLKKATFIEMEKFADAWWDYVGGVGSRELIAAEIQSIFDDIVSEGNATDAAKIGNGTNNKNKRLTRIVMKKDLDLKDDQSIKS